MKANCVNGYRMSSLLSTAFLLLALSGMLFQSATEARKSSPTWSSSRTLDAAVPPKKLSQMTCDRNASCAPGVQHVNTCFCDSPCRVYGDCCPDYVDEEGGRPLTPLPSQLFTCTFLFPDHFYIITGCPASYDVQFVLDGCRLGSASERHPSDEIFYVVPVSSRTSGLVYQNVYCALCHGEEDVGFWNVKLRRCHEPAASETESAGEENVEDLMEQKSLVGKCVSQFLPLSNVPPRRCVDSIDACPDGANAEAASRCTQPSNVAYVYDRRHHKVYRNRHCAACHGIPDYSLSCSFGNIGWRTPPVESFAIVLDLNVGKGTTVGTDSGGSRTQRLGSCPDRQVYDPFAGSCRPIACPPGHSFGENGQCQQSGPVFRTIIQPPDDADCVWIRFRPSEYQALSNGSIYVRLHDTTYDVDSYRLDDNQTAYVCTAFQRNYTEWDHEALRVDAVGTYLSLVCSVVSLLALAFQFGVYMAFPVLRNTPGRCIICLVVSLFVGQLLFLLVKAGSSVSLGFCVGQAAVMHFAFTAAFFWMNVMAFDVYRTFSASPGAAASSSSPAGARRRFAGYSTYAWVSAAVVVGIGVGLDLADVGGAFRPHYGHRICWFGSREGLLILFGVPVGVLLVANIVMFALSVRQIRNASNASKMAAHKSDQTPLLVGNFILQSLSIHRYSD